MGFDLGAVVAPFATIVLTLFIAELTDKDALLLLALATRIRLWIAFAAGAVAFTITSAVIVTAGYFLVNIVPVFWIRLIGGILMIGFGIWQYQSTKVEEDEEKRLIEQTKKKSALSIFLGAVALLILLDLAGDATEVITIVFVARYSNPLLVFVGAIVALVTATAVETALGNTLKKYLSSKRLRILSLVVLLIIGSAIIITTLF